ncbi:MAG: hypothetical protein M0R76_11620, partial [Proteobacteria bacterium]|nr:hypothetical protein [Pseudomonadota bacterium]
GRLEGLQEGEAQGIAKGREEGEARGIAKGLQKGREEGLRLGALSSLLRQVEIKFGAISDDDKERLSQFDHEQITRALSLILTATAFEDIL